MPKKKKVFELTKEGLQTLKAELEQLKDVKRPEVVQLLQAARMQGDLSENADYDAARDLQARIESRIKEVENIIENAQIIRVTNSNNKITIGKTVKMKFVEKNKEATYKLVGTIEANPAQNKISIDSPVGRSILGKSLGDRVLVNLENGKTFHVEIVEVTNG
ncbi:MAG: transcription elongation factor GreA [Acholeplasmataceae bacterium]|nr:transcription elongation factor GreA [Acholeplasmataceae bacterium]